MGKWFGLLWKMLYLRSDYEPGSLAILKRGKRCDVCQSTHVSANRIPSVPCYGRQVRVIAGRRSFPVSGLFLSRGRNGAVLRADIRYQQSLAENNRPRGERVHSNWGKFYPESGIFGQLLELSRENIPRWEC